jgi:hypothetical protein
MDIVNKYIYIYLMKKIWRNFIYAQALSFICIYNEPINSNTLLWKYQCNTHWEFSRKPHHSLYKAPLLSPIFPSSPIYYRMTRQGWCSNPSSMNNTHKHSIVNCLLYIATTLHISTCKYYQYSQSRHDTKRLYSRSLTTTLLAFI